MGTACGNMCEGTFFERWFPVSGTIHSKKKKKKGILYRQIFKPRRKNVPTETVWLQMCDIILLLTCSHYGSSSIYKSDVTGTSEFCRLRGSADSLLELRDGNQKVYSVTWGCKGKMNRGTGTRLALYIASNLSSHFCHLPSPLFLLWGMRDWCSEDQRK